MKLFTIFKILLVLVGGFFAVNLGIFYYHDMELKSRFRMVAKQSRDLHDFQIIELLKKDLKEFDIPADAGQIQIRRDGQRAEISLKYQRSIVIKFGGNRIQLLEVGFSPTVIESY